MANKTVAQLYQENYSTPEVAQILADQEGLDINLLRQDFGDDEIISQFGERYGPLADEGMKPSDKLPVGGNELYEMRTEYDMSDKDLAQYFTNMLGLDYDALKSDGFSDQQIIGQATEARDVSTTQAAAEGAVRGTTSAAGALAGGIAGSAFGPLGIVGGAVLGAFAADTAQSFFRPERPIQNVPYEGFFSLTSNVTLAGAPHLALRQIEKAGRNVIAERSIAEFAEIFRKNGNSMSKAMPSTLGPLDKLLQATAQRPTATFGLEAFAGTMAAGFGTVAERERPGEPITRMVAETVGGGTGAPAYTKLAVPIFDKIKSAFGGLTDADGGGLSNMRANAIRKKLVPILEEAGEDPQQLLQTLQRINSKEFVDEMKAAAELEGVDLGPRLTAALTGSPTLAKLQGQATATMAPGPTLERATMQNLQGLTKLIDIMSATNDPSLMSAAGDLQVQLFDALNQQIVDGAVSKQLDTAEKVIARQADGIKAGRIINEALNVGIQGARATEREFYGAVDKATPASATNVVKTYDDMVANELLPESPMPVFIRKFVERVSGRDVEGAGPDPILADINTQIKDITTQQNKLLKTYEDLKDAGGDAYDIFYESIMGTRAQAEYPKDIDGAIRDLNNIVSDYRATGSDQLGSRVTDLTTRRRVARMAETQIKILRNRQESSRLMQAKNEVTADAEAGVYDAEAPEIVLNDLMKFRSEMLDMARSAAGAGNYRDARLYNKMGQAALDDLGVRASSIEQRIKAGEEISANEEALVRAYQYSRSLNDVFTRSFAGDVLGTTKTGKDRIFPELIPDLINGGSANATNLKLNQIREAARFAAENAGEDFAETLAANVDTTDAALETILRQQATKLFDAETKELNAGNLAKFLMDNEESLKLFPSLKADLENAGTAQKVLADVQDQSSKLREGLEDEITFTFFVGATERPEMRLGNAIGDPAKWAAGTGPETPVKNFDALARVARQGAETYSPRVMDGFKKVIMDHASTFAGVNDNSLDFAAYKQYWTAPLNGKKGGENMLGLMQKHGIMSKTELVNFNKLINQADFIYSEILKGTPTEEIVADAPSEAFDLVVRLAGSTLGQRAASLIPGRGGGQDLVAAGAGVRFARNTFLGMPTGYFDNMVLEAIKDPKAMELILASAPKNSNDKIRLQRQMNSWLVNSGLAQPVSDVVDELNLATMRYNEQQRRKQDVDAAEIESYLQSLPPEVPSNAPAQPVVPAANVAPTPTTPNVAPPAVSPNAAPQPQAPQATNMQTMYPQLFPNDPLGNLIASRGPR